MDNNSSAPWRSRIPRRPTGTGGPGRARRPRSGVPHPKQNAPGGGHVAQGTTSARARPARPPRRRPARALPAKSGKEPFPRAPPGDRQKGPRAGGRGGTGWGGGGRRVAPKAEPHRAAGPGPADQPPRHRVRAGPRGEERAFPRWRRHSPKETRGPSGRRGPGCGGGLGPRTHAPAVGEHTAWPRAEALGMARRGWQPTQEAAADASAAEKEKALSTRRQPSLQQRTPPASTYSRRRAPRDRPRLAPPRSPAPRMTQPQPTRRPGRMSPTAAIIGPPSAGGHAPRGEPVHVGRAGPLPAALPWCPGTFWPPLLVSGGGRGAPSPCRWRSSSGDCRGRDQGHSSSRASPVLRSWPRLKPHFQRPCDLPHPEATPGRVPSLPSSR